jgi:hypothetical protein
MLEDFEITLGRKLVRWLWPFGRGWGEEVNGRMIPCFELFGFSHFRSFVLLEVNRSERKHRESARLLRPRDRTLTTTCLSLTSAPPYLETLVFLISITATPHSNQLTSQTHTLPPTKPMGSIFLTHLPSAWHVDQAIVRPSFPTAHTPPLTHTALRRIPPRRPTLRLGRPPCLHDHGRTPLQCIPNLPPSPTSR